MRITLTLTVAISMLCSNALYADFDVNQLQKLFTDKKQRAQIDAIRSGQNIGAGLKQSDKIKVNGYMTRSDGKSVVWLNNQNTINSSKIDSVRVDKSTIGHNKEIKVSVEGKTRRLKPGETWMQDTGEVVENE